MTIGERIKRRRLQLGMSVDELADELGKNRATVYRYEKDESCYPDDFRNPHRIKVSWKT